MPKTCRTCNETKALNRDLWWKDNRFKDGWSTQCKTCSRIQMRKVADARMKEVHCVICNKIFPCYPDTSRRYRLTCSRYHQRLLMSNEMYVRSGKRNHSWNFTPEGEPVEIPDNQYIPTNIQPTDNYLPEDDFASSFNPF